MKPSRYLEKFRNMAAAAGDAFTLTGDFILVERIADEELKTKSGIIIAAPAKAQIGTLLESRPSWARVLLTGAGYYSQETNEAGDTIEVTTPLDVVPGDIVLLPAAGIKYFSIFGELEGCEADSIGLSTASEIQLKFHGEEGYNRAFGALNSAVKGQVEATSSCL